jgi:flagellin-like hook-associated protein FlgL
MINGLGAADRTISALYASSGQELASVMAKIAAGKRYVQPSDDFVAFLRTNRYESDIRSYDLARTNLGAAKVYTDAAQQVGGKAYENLTKMAQIQDDYAAALISGDTDIQASLTSQFNALREETNNLEQNANINGTNLATAAVLTTVTTGGTTPQTLTIAPTPLDDISGLVVTGAGTAATAATNALTYLTDVQGWGKTLDTMASITDTIIAGKKSAIEEVSGINEAEELAKVTDLQIRQQAAISMMSQANVSRQGILQLFM